MYHVNIKSDIPLIIGNIIKKASNIDELVLEIYLFSAGYLTLERLFLSRYFVKWRYSLQPPGYNF